MFYPISLHSHSHLHFIRGANFALLSSLPTISMPFSLLCPTLFAWLKLLNYALRSSGSSRLSLEVSCAYFSSLHTCFSTIFLNSTFPFDISISTIFHSFIHNIFFSCPNTYSFTTTEVHILFDEKKWRG